MRLTIKTFKAVAIFGRCLRRGHDATGEVADRLQAAQAAGQISAHEFDEVLAADLLWKGQLREPAPGAAGGQVILVVESSWLAETADVERAIARANILRKIGLPAAPVVAGQKWTDEAAQTAREQAVVMTTDGRLDHASWQAVMRAGLEPR